MNLPFDFELLPPIIFYRIRLVIHYFSQISPLLTDVDQTNVTQIKNNKLKLRSFSHTIATILLKELSFADYRYNFHVPV